MQNKGAGPRWIARSESGESEEFPNDKFRSSPRWNNLRSEPPKDERTAPRHHPAPSSATPSTTSTARCPFWKVAGNVWACAGAPAAAAANHALERPPEGTIHSGGYRGIGGRVRTRALCIRPNGGPAVANARYPGLSWLFYCVFCSLHCKLMRVFAQLLLFCRVSVDGGPPSVA